MLTVLYRVLVLPFYIRNAGTFGLVFYFAFGFMRPMDHEALIASALGSFFLLILFALAWVLYTARTVSFIRGQLAIPEHLFLQTFRLVPIRRRCFYWFVLFTQLLLPIIGYAAWMLARAVHYQSWASLLFIILAVLCLLIGSVLAVDYRLLRPAPDTVRLPSLRFRLPYELFFPTYWLRHEPLSLVFTKLISCGILVGICRLYPTDDYDQRLLLIGLMLAIITHSQVGRQLHQFEQRYLLLLANLPLSVARRFGQYALIYGLIWFPELLIVLHNGPISVPVYYLIGLWLTGWGWIMLLHSLGYSRSINPDRWQIAIFWGFIGGLLAIMFGWPLLAWGVVGWLVAVGYWYRSSRRRVQL
ncbi:hypothetical protein [Spirosoma utsteinense]|uniref:ABC transporter permease n=1 Tax=Spirosoma utsteinense TaxID=2585773 RepID=A0ABR6VZB3_9BACT|nr:hypothetical protein [Spirosoma utsteinense]MBC3784581.1 hypothetical protein [Spirosoma utsteinense]MBC3789667.1 hypothetical protein [Spirosoma utsteinense]